MAKFTPDAPLGRLQHLPAGESLTPPLPRNASGLDEDQRPISFPLTLELVSEAVQSIIAEEKAAVSTPSTMAALSTSHVAGRPASLRVLRPCANASRVFGVAALPPRPLTVHRPAAQIEQSQASASSDAQVRANAHWSERPNPQDHLTEFTRHLACCIWPGAIKKSC